ncbi:hypothetical protein DEIGR_100854 [Deinococcus grandis]|uniref:Uncharacterized protein n=1 Tax=Deinococcus grandis TaxID=57498 RepID=A0A100HHT3_9DEIO|nr:hypothetical protein [Deinococcus grandis]BBN95687.1 hypothetical protein DEGR_24200 [Deinococcus grandis]GAQ20827.1 hypothetical protein DEIGR_100854 [Deinococcus grandis]
MAVTPLDLLAALALLAFVSGMGGVTYRAVMLLIQLIAPKPHWQERGALLIILALGYIVLLALDVPSVLASLRDNSSHATLDSVLRTSVFAAWLWVLNTILLMLARGTLGPQPRWRR